MPLFEKARSSSHDAWYGSWFAKAFVHSEVADFGSHLSQVRQLRERYKIAVWRFLTIAV